jgi:hypothetical protein
VSPALTGSVYGKKPFPLSGDDAPSGIITESAGSIAETLLVIFPATVTISGTKTRSNLLSTIEDLKESAKEK